MGKSYCSGVSEVTLNNMGEIGWYLTTTKNEPCAIVHNYGEVLYVDVFVPAHKVGQGT